MTRLRLRKGLTLQPIPEGGGHLTDSRTGDSLVVPTADFDLLRKALHEHLDLSTAEVAEVLDRYRPFFIVEAAPTALFYELDIEDAPMGLEIPSIAPVEASVTLSETELSLKAALEASTKAGAVTELTPLFEVPSEREVPSEGEVPSEKKADEDLRVPGGEQPAASGQYLSQEENLRQVMETRPPAPVTAPELAALFGESAVTKAAAPAAPRSMPKRSSTARPVFLALAGIGLLGLGVLTTWLLRPEPPSEQPPVVVNVVTQAPDASLQAQLIVDANDAGSPGELGESPDSGDLAVALAPVVVDAGIAEPLVEVRTEGEADDSTWLTSEVQARGRVKMGEVIAETSGTVTWTIDDGQRVKGKQVLGKLSREGAEDSLLAPAVGLALLKLPSGSEAKRGSALAEIIYFEAWAKGQVKGKVPAPSWRCEVVSALANKRAECRISVVTPKAGGALITVAIEPRWFDEASDAVLRVSP